jgi:hypothetical protein
MFVVKVESYEKRWERSENEVVSKEYFARHCEGEARSNPVIINILDCFAYGSQ